jgi:uncharacterized repeat protein (TIGR01451 family)
MIRCRQYAISAGQVIALAGSLAMFSAGARAKGTAAGLTIANTADVTYSLGANTLSATSNSTQIKVDEILDVAVSIQSASLPVAAGSTNRALTYRVTNTGNGTEAFALATDSAITGDTFDPVPAAPAIYFDTDGSGDFSAGDTAYVSGTNDPTLAPDASLLVFVVNNIPAGLPDGATGRNRLTARALTGDGPAGTVFAGQGQGGTDAIAGTSTAKANITGDYVIAQAQVSVVKSQTIVDPFGGARPIPGARIDYQLIVSAAGATAAQNVVLDDAIPQHTTYVPGSLRLQNIGLSDAADGDAGQFNATPAPAVRVAIGALDAAAGTRTVRFSVTID